MDMLQQFIRFVESKPANETYQYQNMTNCALAQFGKFLHPNEEKVFGSANEFYIDDNNDDVKLFKVMDYDHPSTFDLLHAKTFGELAIKLQEYKTN